MWRIFLITIFLLLSNNITLADIEEAVSAAERGDHEAALKEWQRLADEGNPEAQFVLGQLYMAGMTVKQDVEQGVKWIHSSAEQGYAEAQHQLGLMYGGGMGVTTDNITAYMWFTLAEINGYEDKYNTREVFDTILSPEQITEAKRLAHEWLEEHKD